MILREELIRFDMDAQGGIIYGEEVISISHARNVIQTAQKANPNIAVIITIDENAIWQNVVYFVELAQDLQVDAFSFSMKKENL